MFKNIWSSIKKAVVKRAIPEIVENTSLTLRTVDRARDKFLLAKLVILDFVVFSREIPLNDITVSSGTITTDIEVTISGGENNE